MELNLRLEDVVSWIPGCRIEAANEGQKVAGVSALGEGTRGTLSFVGDGRHAELLERCGGTYYLVREGDPLRCPDGKVFLRVTEPSIAMALVCRRIEKMLWPEPEPGIHPSAWVHPQAVLGVGVSIGPMALVNEGAELGAGVCLASRATVGRFAVLGASTRIAESAVVGDYTRVGARCWIGPGAVLGGPGFGYRFDPESGAHLPVPQIGRVVLEDDVDVGPNSTIDRGRVGDTRIGRGTKIDNLVHIAHNVKTGRGCIFCAQVGISGSVEIGDYVVFGGQVGVVDHVRIADRIQVGGQTGIMSDHLEPGVKLFGNPAQEMRATLKVFALQKRLPELFKRLTLLEKQASKEVNE